MSNKWRRPKQLQNNQPQTRLAQQLQFTATQTIYSAPIPPPEVLAKLEEVCPGSANRILTRFEEQGHHRQKLETTALQGNINSERLGQIFAFILFITALIGGIVLIAVGKDVLGLASVIGSLVIPTALFLLGRKGGIRELLAKRKAVEALTKPQTHNESESNQS